MHGLQAPVLALVFAFISVVVIFLTLDLKKPVYLVSLGFGKLELTFTLFSPEFLTLTGSIVLLEETTLL